MSLVSVIIPVYNVENYLDKCVRSILEQSYSEIEVLLVDDGSTDSSGDICDEYEAKDSRVKVIHKQNGGLSDARNVGIDYATGEYLTFVDSDDYLEPDAIESMMNIAIDYSCQIVITNMKRFYDDGTREGFYEPVSNQKIYTDDSKYETLMQPSVCNKIFASRLFENIRFPKGKYYEDTFVYHKLLYRADKVGLTGKTGYWYLSRKGSILGRNPFTDRYFDFLEAVSKRMYFLNEKHIAYYGTEACLSYYNAYANALSNIEKTEENNEKFKKAEEWFLDAYCIVIKDKDISLKQKIKMFLLKNAPKIHAIL